MHISEGILNPEILASSWVVSSIGIGIGLKKMDLEKTTLASLLCSFFFVASLIHIPLGPTSVHLILNGLLGILLGWLSFPVIFIALLLQAIFFQFGGLIVLGANTFNMASGAIVAFFIFRILKKIFRNIFLSGFFASLFAVFTSAILISFELILVGEKFLNVSKFIVLAHIPVMIIEGIITGFLLLYLKKVKPEIILFFFLLIFSKNLYAHRVNVFAYRENNNVYTESYFSDGSPCKNSDIFVYDEKDKLILKGRTDEKGLFSFPFNEKKNLKIVLKAPGHRNEFFLKTDESSNEKEIEKEKKNLKVKLKDVLAGLGYIFGILGLLTYLRYRKYKNAS